MENKDFITKLLEIITEEQILQILEEFGAFPHKIKDNEIWFKTICHGGDSHKLCYFRNSKEFYCYTNCGKMNLFSFIMNVKECNFNDAINFLKAKLKFSNRKGIHSTLKEDKILKELTETEMWLQFGHKLKSQQTNEFNKTPLQNIDNKIMDYFEDVYYKGWIEEGISIETMQKYNIKWYGLENHIIIPHYDIEGNLVGIRRRTLQERELLEGTKYMPEIIQGKTYTHSLNFNLYGLDKNKEAIKKYKKVVIVEAEKSVLLSDTFYGEDSIVVATCGFNISNWQKEILLSLGVEEIILGFDKDFNPKDFEITMDLDNLNYKKYLNFCDRITKFSKSFQNECVVSVLWDEYDLLDLKDSPFDKGKNIYETLFRKRVKMDRFKD